MFFFTYLRRELRRRFRQAVVIALGLALGIGLVVTVTAASAGVRKAQAAVLSSLYGVGTDVTVTGAAPGPPGPPGSGAPPKNAQTFQISPAGARICQNGKCRNAAGTTTDTLDSGAYGPLSQAEVAAVARLAGVKAAAGGLTLTDNRMTIPKNFGQPGSPPPAPDSVSVDGVDTSRLSMGPLSAARITAGRSLAAADAHADVAVVDSGYAKAHKLTAGGKVTIAGTAFRVIGIAAQPQSGSPPAVYIPLARAQALGGGPGGSLRGKVNTIYVTAASAAAIPAVQREIRKLLPSATVTTAASLASQVTGSLASTARVASVLGRWLSILVLAAAFAVASLLTVAAVTRRSGEFGTLKALGWRSRRIIAQVLGESVAVGAAGAVAGAGLGFAGAAVIPAIAPKLTATVATATGLHIQSFGGPGPRGIAPSAAHTVSVPMSAPVTAGAVGAAVLLALLGALLAGSLASWRIARLRPAEALTRVA